MASSRAPDPNAQLSVHGLGMVTALGQDAVTSCAAARAGILRITTFDDRLDWDDESATAEGTRGHGIPLLTRGFVGVGRLLRLAVGALQDLLSRVDLSTAPRLGVVLNVPSVFYFTQQFRPGPDAPPLDPALAEMIESEEELRHAKMEQLLAKVVDMAGLAPLTAARQVILGDEVGFVTALDQAHRWMDEGVVDACIVGGVDSQADPETLHALYALHVVKTKGLPVGRVPGEGAAMLWVESRRTARRPGSAEALALLGGLATEDEPADRFAASAHTGEALYKATAQTVARLPGAPQAVDLVIGDLTGEEHRAREWGHAQLRLRQSGLLAARREWYPASAFGALGAATGPAAVGLACRGFARDYGAERAAMVWLMSDVGRRGSFWIGRP